MVTGYLCKRRLLSALQYSIPAIKWRLKLSREELVAASITLPTGSETLVKAFTGVTGKKILLSKDKLYQKRQVDMTNGFIKVKTHLPFLVKVVNFSDEPGELKKNQLHGAANPAPGSIVSVHAYEGLT